MATDTTDVVQEAEKLLAKITPDDEHVRRSRYDHGGGRMFREVGDSRSLIIDAYEEGDREFYFNAPRLVRSLLTQLAEVTQQRDVMREALSGLIKATDGSPGPLATADAVIAARKALRGQEDR